jgi:DNA-3-methyladenine glycosylase I
MSLSDPRPRCPWSAAGELERAYHDTEWGVPCRSDAGQFEFLILESAQAGLSWATILRKREGYRACFAGFDAEKTAAFTQRDIERLMRDPSIVRNRKKIEAAVANARVFLEIAARRGSFSRYIWDFVDGRTVHNAWARREEVPAVTPLAQKAAREMRREGFRFLGPVILYAHMQATGMVNDHLVSCFRYEEIRQGDECPNRRA